MLQALAKFLPRVFHKKAGVATKVQGESVSEGNETNVNVKLLDDQYLTLYVKVGISSRFTFNYYYKLGWLDEPSWSLQKM